MGPRSYVPSLFRRRASTLSFLGRRSAAPRPPGAPAAADAAAAPPPWGFADPAAVAKAREKHPRAYEPWTPYEEQRLALELAAGRSVLEVAASLERPAGAVRARATRVAARAAATAAAAGAEDAAVSAGSS